MKSVLTWTDRGLSRTDSAQVSAYDLAFRPDGQQVIVAAGLRVLVYDTGDGEVVRTLKGHKGAVYAVAWSSDGKRFASGGADNTIVIWKSTLEGVLKYNHSESVQSLSYNPVTHQLCSCTSSDFGLWSPEQKSVNKTKVSSKILCCSWSSNGQFLALGHMNGLVSIRDKEGVETVRIDRQGPVWSLAWNPVPSEDQNETLAVGDWSQRIGFFHQNGAAVKSAPEREVGFDPCCVAWFGNGEYLVTGGSDKKVSLWTKEGVFLTTVAEKDDWVWACRPKPKQNHVAVCDNSGVVSMYQLVFNTVHGLYQDRYAYREFMTDVVIQQLATEKKVRIRCKDCVKKIAIYKDRLAVQLPNQIVVYELLSDDEATAEIRPKIKWRISKNLECFLLVVTGNHLVLCQERKLQLYNFKGEREREWALESLIRYIKVVGGPRGREGLLVGLKSGLILEIFVDNPFPIPLIRQTTSVRCLDLSASRKKLAVVDENSQVLVYDLTTKALLYTEPNASSVAWNTDFEDMLSFSGNGFLNIKSGNLPVHQQKMQGFVVGFKGSKIYTLHVYSMQSVDVPHSATLYRYLEQKDFDRAYAVACLGVTDADWKLLATEALRALSLVVAQKSFVRVRDLRHIQLIQRIEQQRKLPDHNDDVFLGDIAAFEGRYKEAADYYVRSGNVKMAIDMYSALHKWTEAKALAALNAKPKSQAPATPSLTVPGITLAVPAPATARSKTPEQAAAAPAPPTLTVPGTAAPEPAAVDDQSSSANCADVIELMKKQAKINEEDKNWQAAADIYWEVGDYTKAVELYGERGLIEELYQHTRELSNKETAALTKAATYFVKHRRPECAVEVLRKVGDNESLMKLHVAEAQWDAALELVRAHPELGELMHVPYANWLALNDQFEKAQSVLVAAGKADAALQILEHLSDSALVTERFEDVAYYTWQLALANVKFIKHPPASFTAEDKAHYEAYEKLRVHAELYFAYHFVYDSTVQPFTTLDKETLFNVARWLQISLPESPPRGIRRSFVLYALAKQSKALGAYKVARFAYDKLLQLRVPQSWLDQLEIGAIAVRSKPFVDKEDLQPLCYRCSVLNPLLGKYGPSCSNCKHPFVFSSWSYEVLPLVEFGLEENIKEEDALKVLSRGTGVLATPRAGADGSGGAAQTMAVGDAADGDEAFAQILEKYEQGGTTEMLRLNLKTLETLRRTEVFVAKPPSPYLPSKFYKSVVPETPVVLCPSCLHFFHEEDYELLAIQHGCCPLCRAGGVS